MFFPRRIRDVLFSVVEGQRKKVKWGLYMWIYLDSEQLLDTCAKILPENLAVEEGLSDDGLLQDDLEMPKRTNKRMRSTGNSSNPVEEHPVRHSRSAQNFIDKVGGAIPALASQGENAMHPKQHTAAEEHAIMASANYTKVQALNLMLTCGDEEVKEGAREKLLALLDSGAFE